MATSFVRSGSLLLPVLCLSLFLPITAASSDLSLSVPLDHSQQHFTVTATSTKTEEEPVSLLMSRLIRTYFGDRERWRPFLPHEVTDTHPRVVRKHHSRPKLQISTQTIPSCEMECKARHEAHVGRTFYLRGNPFLVSSVPAFDITRPTPKELLLFLQI
ncbi:uncharacterized protein [Physcomitrium patens]|uniref:Uncharacterized protein n=1 Tax=Physcomitrium patens TaxID=3218 RepID=A9S9U1_PHYPA|nr:uncharacterized protein LOC112287446 [Physcomitrium patens]PNR62735.1 hypothetical protein PHYPA_001159 [Physcomitrium patens]|eukprot:XP_024386198.1 uncharacterized protein LOC112287446 [Physcomitrella patens]